MLTSNAEHKALAAENFGRNVCGLAALHSQSAWTKIGHEPSNLQNLCAI